MFKLSISCMERMLLYHSKYNKIVSLIDPKTKIQKKHQDHFIIEFDDINVDMATNKDGITIHGYSIPQKHHVEKILNFTKDFTNDDEVLIHCHQGISRSTAMGIIVLCQHGMNPEQALKNVLMLRPIAWPNERLIPFGDELLEFNGKLIKTIDAWRKTQKVHFNAEE